MNGKNDGIGGWMNGWTDGMGGWMNGMNEQTAGWTWVRFKLTCVYESLFSLP